MHSSTIIFPAILAFQASSFPTTAQTRDIMHRANIWAFPNYRGQQKYISGPRSSDKTPCTGIPNPLDIGSMRPIAGWACAVYAQYGCKGYHISVTDLGTTNVKQLLKKVPKSVDCVLVK